MKILFRTIICTLILIMSGVVMAENAYDFSFKNISGKGDINLADYKGEVIMVVNTASLCGFTKQYTELEKLYEAYKDKGFVIIGVPSNDFGGQEPKANAEVANFCETNFGIKFPLAEKTRVQSRTSHPFFVWTRSKLGYWSGPKWNFYKYLIGTDGELIDWFSSLTSPASDKITKLIENHLP